VFAVSLVNALSDLGVNEVFLNAMFSSRCNEKMIQLVVTFARPLLFRNFTGILIQRYVTRPRRTYGKLVFNFTLRINRWSSNLVKSLYSPPSSLSPNTIANCYFQFRNRRKVIGFSDLSLAPK